MQGAPARLFAGAGQPRRHFDQMGASIPAGRIATPADVAPVYLYLLENDFMTGETIHIDGGQRLV
ncbi:MAG: SDR family oxidoreductase [Mesorhizobium sp.]|uniref:SDR family oxidoreductase n=1 Tax=unclassified Mesorhizobium TaxID=325217 RepID=UPI000F765654|nr:MULTISPECIES: SDR family oxidoreductase [unclassified Mesorhizobium]AZO70441.1 SDR family oxidoreductase [Mesorhizobium sp. M1D.F.Ca.ET.043.01.1.1]RWA88014.1 MAG: SDR family oxidoreductase [Mesorhizobium sp.]RWE16144.1 MAG: SDR family oxidoreductase [Mesorhizobium sp.]TJW82949.1 MAG: SDR family oxidoreductase [Mesorhizobium sp.]